MKIPGLDEIMANMKKFDEVLPVLKSIDNNLRILTKVTIESLPQDEKSDYLNQLSE